MRLKLWMGWLVAGLTWLAVPAWGGERPQDFLQALRNRDYFDYALFYIDELEARPNLDAELRQTLTYERGATLLAQAERTRDSDAQQKLFDEARGQFEKFVKEYPQHPLAGAANSEIAEVVMGKARALVWQANSPNNSGRKDELRKQARDLLVEARRVYQAAFERYKAEHDSFDKFIPQNDKRYAAREKAFVNAIQAEFHLGQVIHQEAQTHEQDSPEFKKLLTDAANAFESIHSRHRSQVIGLYARMWQGKCFEEMDELTKALGIYNELLEHRGKDGSPLEDLQNRVLQFRMVCLNNDLRKDYRVVMQEADAWRKAHRGELNTRVGLGIQWEQARAEELLARAEDTPEVEKRKMRQGALDTARRINRFPGEYKDASTAMIRRLLADLERGTGDPKDFATAFSLARTQVEEIRNKNAAVAQAQGPEKQKLQDELQPILRETARTLALALNLAGKRDDVAEVNRARYFLAYVYFLMRDRSHESGVLAEWVARKYRKEQSDLALDAGYLAQAAYIQAYHREAKDRRGPEIAWVVDICNYITQNWPASDKAQDARMNLGGLYAELGQPAEAAKWYGTVPESAPQYLDAQLKAGNAWWDVYVQEQTRSEAERKPRDQIDELLNQSRQILTTAIGKFEGNLPKEAAQVDPAKMRDLTLAKLTLASILNGAGDYKGGLGLLVDSPLSSVAGLPAFQKGTKPYLNVAIAVYIQVLRAYIGSNELVKAQEAQQALDAIVKESGGGGKALTQVYVDFGTQLKKEVQRLQAARDPRLAEVLKSFETFLDEVAKRKDSQSYYSLRWIGETYRDLGEGLASGDRVRAEGYFGKAVAAYRQILDEELKSPGFLPAEMSSGVELAIVRCLRLQQSFPEAEKGILKILKARPRALDAQEEAAQLYADWGARGAKGDLTKWNLAIEGNQNLKSRKPENRVVWGWFGIAQRLENALNQGGATDETEDQYLNARYQTALTRFHWAQAEPDGAKRRLRLGTAFRDIKLAATTMPDLGGDEGYQRFNTLYRDVQQEMLTLGKCDEVAGQTSPKDLEKKSSTVAGRKTRKKAPLAGTAETASAGTTDGDEPRPRQSSKSSKSKKTQSKPAETQAPESGGTLVLWLVGAGLLAGAAGVAYTLLKPSTKGKRRRALDLTLPDSVSAPEGDLAGGPVFESANGAAAPRAKPRVAKPAKPSELPRSADAGPPPAPPRKRPESS
ncbi:MAG: hypothetical protein ACK5EA_20590 [Planctomycetaceae bacterium]